MGHVEGDDVAGFNLRFWDGGVGEVAEDFAEGGVAFVEVVSAGWAVHQGEGKAAFVERDLTIAGGEGDDEAQDQEGVDEAAFDCL